VYPRNLPGHTAESFDTDGIPFIVNKSATCIITNDCSLFLGNLIPVQVTVDTIQNSKTRQCYKGTLCLGLVDDANIKHTYDIPGAIYDTAPNFNLLGIPKLAKYFMIETLFPEITLTATAPPSNLEVVGCVLCGITASMCNTLCTRTPLSWKFCFIKVADTSLPFAQD
jgi:hypothetical protein